MRNRKTVIVAFMLVACMILAVGFAAMADQLDIAGTSEVSFANAQNAMDADVYFKSASTGTGYTAWVVAEDVDRAGFKVTGLSNVGDTITITFTIANDNAFAVSCVMDPENTAATRTDYFTYTTNVGDSAFQIAANSTYDVTVTVELIQLPQLSEGQILSGSFDLQYDVTDVVAAG